MKEEEGAGFFPAKSLYLAGCWVEPSSVAASLAEGTPPHMKTGRRGTAIESRQTQKTWILIPFHTSLLFSESELKQTKRFHLLYHNNQLVMSSRTLCERDSETEKRATITYICQR